QAHVRIVTAGFGGEVDRLPVRVVERGVLPAGIVAGPEPPGTVQWLDGRTEAQRRLAFARGVHGGREEGDQDGEEWPPNAHGHYGGAVGRAMSSRTESLLPAFLGGRVCLDFANTVGWRTSEAPLERLPDYAALLGWSERRRTLSRARVRRRSLQ